MKIAILGAGGCFGLNLSQYLLKQGHQVIGIGRFQPKSPPFSLEISHQNYAYHALHMVYELDMIQDVISNQNPDAVVNFAALAEVPLSWKYPERYFETNVMAHIRLHALLTKEKIPLVHIGTSELYGSNNRAVDESAPLRCSSPYAVSKAAFDMYLETQKTDWLIVRPSNAYCPGQLLHRVIPRAIMTGLFGGKMPLNGGGVVKKSYIHATDLSRGILMLIERNQWREIYNVGPDEPTAIRDVVATVAAHYGKTLDEFCDITPPRPNEDACYWLDSSKIRALGWMPEITLTDGIKDMAAWGEKYRRQLLQESPDYKMRA